jgi:outer membrane protein assembly factor BamB
MKYQRKHSRVLFLCVLGACAWSFASHGVGQDWPQWRGPNRDGVATGFKLPDIWPRQPLQAVWTVPLGDGYSAPVIVAGKLYTHAREASNEFVYCLDALTGKQIWRHGYAAPYEMNRAATGHGPGPKATTTVVDGRVYAFGISSILTCLDAQSGEVIWSRDLKEEYEAAPAEFGTAGSPLVDGPFVIVPVGGKKGGSVMAFHKKDGSLAWKAIAGELPAFSSPIAADLGGIRHVLTFTEKHFVGLDATNGRELWKYPFTTAYRQNTVTPVVVGDLVIASGLDKFAFALQVKKSGSGVKMTEAWKNRDLRIYMSSPVVVGDHIYGLGGQNALVCVHIPTGKTAWSSGDFGEYCSIVVARDRLLILDTVGNLAVVKADPKSYQEVGRSQVSEGKTWSHLALVQSRIYVRNREQLACIDLLGKAAD